MLRWNLGTLITYNIGIVAVCKIDFNDLFEGKKVFSLYFQALERFTPEERDCYMEDEIDLKYLPKKHGYRYEMSNCLFEAAYEKILEVCRCAPG